MVMTFFVAELAALFFVFGKERERKEREPVTGEMRRNAGEDRAGTQGWQGSCQVAMPVRRRQREVSWRCAGKQISRPTRSFGEQDQQAFRRLKAVV